MALSIDIKNKIKSICGKESCLFDEPMSRHTTFKTGGNADCYVTPKDEDEIIKLLKYFSENNIKHIVMGKGSNIVFSDKGYDGVVISLLKSFDDVKILVENGEMLIWAQAGALMTKIAMEAAKFHLAGFEFASGIPGTIGGGVIMNAGAYDGEIKEVFYQAEYIEKDESGKYEIKSAGKDEGKFGYRTSKFKKDGDIILSVKIKLTPKKDSVAIFRLMKELAEKRLARQPIDRPSAGSTFKRPEGYFAGKLIEDAGLRGFCLGGAQVSEKHCGFVINAGNATSQDVYNMVKYIRKTVYDKFNVMLEPEIVFIGEFD